MGSGMIDAKINTIRVSKQVKEFCYWVKLIQIHY